MLDPDVTVVMKKITRGSRTGLKAKSVCHLKIILYVIIFCRNLFYIRT